MTIRVTVKNEDSRETAVIGVRVQGIDEAGIPMENDCGPETQLKGGQYSSGESINLYVHSNQQILVREIRQ